VDVSLVPRRSGTSAIENTKIGDIRAKALNHFFMLKMAVPLRRPVPDSSQPGAGFANVYQRSADGMQ
jgi:hypothetical protein